jgi:RNA polymerase sigma factor (sigma-70 family)
MRSRDPFRHAERLADSVYAYVAYRIGAGAAAEDVTGEAFARGWRYRRTYDPSRGTPESWLIGIARRVLAEGFGGREVPMDELPEREDPADEYSRCLDRITLAQAMDRLPDRDRELLAMRYGAQMSTREIADHLKIEANTIDVALTRARRRLRGMLGEPPRPRRGAPAEVLDLGC